MNELLRQLKELTTLDATLVQTREQLARYPAMLAKLEAAEAAQRKTIAEAETDLEKTLRERRQAEKEVATLEEKIRRVHAQQSEVKTNKEYQAINTEIAGLKAKIDERETAGLEKLEAEDAIQKRKKTTVDQLAAQHKDNDAERERIQIQTIEKQDRLTRLASERVRKLAELPDDLREIYEQLNQRFPGSAVAPLEGETCGGCHWGLVAQTRQQVRAGKDMIRCEHCHRYLFMPGA